ncbi:amidase, hydantoinase/carbamoylase family protein [Halalkalicoccus jeotgali B3]|uniref:Amidase, hydantoinase/carbamoylase family protein n=2 Tax=Halalkalicoccus jeotgali TaxID=413810 RepID=D8JCC5_HALJB|nr:amidase, hydantoinase/carbamoylase family protein [Halalkalicoccus jeotgali B3]ELY38805.1 amidase, hydantoinase/carbamoylase family protein [Halalkalicoccus jeotgali B3]
MGSGVFTDKFETEEILSNTDRDGISVEAALQNIGYDGESPAKPMEDIHAYLEVHIEQGPVLEQNETNVGIVDGVFGMSWLEATIYGEADHAGPSPIHSRNDALVAAADAVTAIRRLSNRFSDDVVTTVGEFSVSPDSINVVPDEVTFSIDLRSYDDDTVARGVEHIEKELETVCEREGTEFELEELWRIPHTEFSPTVCDIVTEAATESDCSYQRIIGGAGHDANYLNDITDAALLFVPSVDGKTHNEAEFTEWEDILAGVDVFARATNQLADQN